MISFSSDGFWSAGMVLLFWSLSDGNLVKLVAALLLLIGSFIVGREALHRAKEGQSND